MYIVYRDTMGSYRIDGIGTISFLDGIPAGTHKDNPLSS